MLSENFGLPVNVDEQAIFQDFAAAFNEAFERRYGQKMSPSALQAVRWFYILDAAKRAGYSYAKTNETISFYLRKAIGRGRLVVIDLIRNRPSSIKIQIISFAFR